MIFKTHLLFSVAATAIVATSVYGQPGRVRKLKKSAKKVGHGGGPPCDGMDCEIMYVDDPGGGDLMHIVDHGSSCDGIDCEIMYVVLDDPGGGDLMHIGDHGPLPVVVPGVLQVAIPEKSKKKKSAKK